MGNDPNLVREPKLIRNAAGLPTEFVNADGTKTTIGYRNSDVLGDSGQFPTYIRDESGRERRFTYYDDGRLKSSSDLAGTETKFGYDPATLRLTSVDLPGPGSVSYGYDANGRIVSIDRPGLGKYEVLDTNADADTDPDFSPDGQPVKVKLPSGETVEMTYDPVTNRLDTRKVTPLGATTPSEWVKYHYQPNSDNLLRIEDLLVPVDQVTYTYYTAADPQPGPNSHIGKLSVNRRFKTRQ